jgi:hypothetical protein
VVFAREQALHAAPFAGEAFAGEATGETIARIRGHGARL